MSTGKSWKGRVIDDAFRREAVRLLSTSGRTAEQVADDLGIGRSTLTKWKSRLAEAELMAGPHDDVHKELARLRRENELLRAERDLLKKATAFFAKETSR
jgi:transposase